MIQLKLVKASSEEYLHSLEEHYGLLHDTKVMLNILQVNKQRHFVFVESYFSSVQACDDLKKGGLKFIGVVKTATRDFCMANLSEIDLAFMGLCKGILCSQ